MFVNNGHLSRLLWVCIVLLTQNQVISSEDLSIVNCTSCHDSDARWLDNAFRIDSVAHWRLALPIGTFDTRSVCMDGSPVKKFTFGTLVG